MAASPPFDLSNIQGDIITQIPKKAQAFFFFQVTNVKGFKSALTNFIPFLATETSVRDGRKSIDQHKRSGGSGLLDLRFTTVAFSSKGLAQLGVKDNVQDNIFTSGQLADSSSLGDKGTTTNGVFEPDWLFPFKHDIHGLFSVSGCSVQIAQLELLSVIARFAGTIREVYRVIGSVRPGAESGHEHFGFLDGISNPFITGLSTETPPEDKGDEIPPGIVLCGREGDAPDDPSAPPRPAWTLDGSILAFRLLNQLVPEFNKFLNDNPLPTSDPSVNGSDLLGARLFGRWKSGAPIMLAPTKDDPSLGGANAAANNGFDFLPKDSQVNCPFAAHIRKTYPRNDLPESADTPHRLLRRGIAFGPEVTPSEAAAHKTELDRGLLFVNYQSSLKRGFHFVQETWANNKGFLPHPGVSEPGFDPIIGQTQIAPNNVGARSLVGTDPTNPAKSLSLTAEWVIPKGGEYFFSPSISAIKGTIAA